MKPDADGSYHGGDKPFCKNVYGGGAAWILNVFFPSGDRDYCNNNDDDGGGGPPQAYIYPGDVSLA